MIRSSPQSLAKKEQRNALRKMAATLSMAWNKMITLVFHQIWHSSPPNMPKISEIRAAKMGPKTWVLLCHYNFLNTDTHTRTHTECKSMSLPNCNHVRSSHCLWNTAEAHLFQVHKTLDVTTRSSKSHSSKRKHKVKSATAEDPESDLPGSSRLVKGKSMPSLRWELVQCPQNITHTIHACGMRHHHALFIPPPQGSTWA